MCVCVCVIYKDVFEVVDIGLLVTGWLLLEVCEIVAIICWYAGVCCCGNSASCAQRSLPLLLYCVLQFDVHVRVSVASQDNCGILYIMRNVNVNWIMMQSRMLYCVACRISGSVSWPCQSYWWWSHDGDITESADTEWHDVMGWRCGAGTRKPTAKCTHVTVLKMSILSTPLVMFSCHHYVLWMYRILYYTVWPNTDN